MNTTNTTNLILIKIIQLLVVFLLMTLVAIAQNPKTEQDTTKTGFSMGPINLPNPNSIVSKYTYDPITDRYIYTETIGNFNIKLSFNSYARRVSRLVLQENLKDYYKQKIDAVAGRKKVQKKNRKIYYQNFMSIQAFLKLFLEVIQLVLSTRFCRNRFRCFVFKTR